MLNSHDKEVLERLKDGEYKTQRQLQTSRQTLNKLIRKGLIKSRLNTKSPMYSTVSNKEYRLCN